MAKVRSDILILLTSPANSNQSGNKKFYVKHAYPAETAPRCHNVSENSNDDRNKPVEIAQKTMADTSTLIRMETVAGLDV